MKTIHDQSTLPRSRKLAACAALICLSTLNPQLSTAFAQGTAFTYQGRLNSTGQPASGTYDFRFRLAADPLGGTYVGSPFLASALPVSNGLFTATLNFGSGIFTGPGYWLEVDVRTNGAGSYTALTPLQALTPTPYAIFANASSNVSGTISAAQLTGQIANGNLPVNPTFSGTVTATAFSGNGAGLTALNASQLTSGTMPDARLSPNVALLAGNQTFTGQNYFLNGIGIGRTSPGYPFEVLAGQAVGRFITTNSVFGSVVVLQNQLTNVAAEYLGAVNFNNAGGGTPGQIGYIANPTNDSDDYIQFNVDYVSGLRLQADPRGLQAASVIGGHPGNTIQQPGSGGDVIAGGGYAGGPNTIATNTSGVFIGAGSANQIGPNVNDSVIVGGYGNTNLSLDAVIGGGYGNLIQTNAHASFIGGGYQNAVQVNAAYSTIGGGQFNTSASNAYVTLGGGYSNMASGFAASVGGGYQNTASGFEAAVGGGFFNTASAITATVGGGNVNAASNAGATVSGGAHNSASGSGGTVPGGFGNNANGDESFAAGTQAQANHTGAFVWADDNPLNFSSTTANQFRVRATGGVAFVTAIDSSGGVTAGVHLLAGDTAWSSISDKNAKKNFQPVNAEAVLEKLAAIPVQQWNYKWEADTSTPHLGPMAQDFKAAFYPGRDDKSISTLEFDGVELAAIQGLNRKLEQKETEITELKQRLDALEKIVRNRK
jgi:hypothetical protein